MINEEVATHVASTSLCKDGFAGQCKDGFAGQGKGSDY